MKRIMTMTAVILSNSEPLSHASRASSPFRGAFGGDAALQKPPLKGEGGPLAVERFPG